MCSRSRSCLPPGQKMYGYKTQEEFPFSQKGKQIMISTVERNVYWFVNPYQRYSGTLKGTVFSTETINSMRIDIMLVLFIVIYCKEKNNANHMVGIPYVLNQGERWKQSQITIKARLPLTVNGEEKPLC